MDSPLLTLVRGEGSTLLSAGESMLLEFALDQFGDPLSQFLLFGLSEDRVLPRWLFTVTFIDRRGVLYSRNVQVVADYRPDMATSVPRGKEPLVLLALLRLLLVDPEFSSPKLSCDQEEVLKLLGWEDRRESRLAIDEAVKRYSTLRYEWSLDERELGEAKLSFFHGASRFISGHSYETIEEDGEIKLTAHHIQFDAEFVKELMGHSLFGIRWDGVNSLERIAC